MLPRLADLLTARPRAVLAVVLAVVLAATAFGTPVAGELSASGGFTPQDAGSAEALRQIERAGGLQSRPGVVLLVQDPDPERLRELAAELRQVAGVAVVGRPLRPERGDAVALPATLRADGDSDDGEVVDDVLARFAGEPDVAVGGNVVAFEQIGTTVEEDLRRAELLAAPLLLLLALVFFRGRAALLPLLVGVTTVVVTFLLLRAVNQAYELSVFALNLVIGLGLGLAIDYTLFLVTRFREELEGGAAVPAAVRTTMATAGRTVAFSAATVAIALVTLTAFPLGFLQSMGLAGALVAVVAAVTSLVVTPALFAVWGTKLRGRPRTGDGRGGWYRLSHAVMRRPVPVSLVTAAVMVAVALPALGVHWTPVDETVIPRDRSARTVADALARDFPAAGTTPVVLAIAAPRGAGERVEAHAREVAALDGVGTVAPPRLLGRGTWQVDVVVEGRPEGDTAHDLVGEVRALDAPFPVLVGGNAAEFVDQQAAIADRLPLAAGLLVLLTCAVLWLMTGSVVLPLKAVAMNLLTVGVALGAITYVFQGGRLTGLLGYTPNGGVEPTDFLVAAATVFALSTDYGVFLLERIREARSGGLGEREAVAVGLERTGRVVTAAAILLAVTIGAFSTSSISFIQQIGIATATGVLLDAFVVRALLVPSLMALLGRRNWWSPPPLRRLHARLTAA